MGPSTVRGVLGSLNNTSIARAKETLTGLRSARFKIVKLGRASPGFSQPPRGGGTFYIGSAG